MGSKGSKGGGKPGGSKLGRKETIKKDLKDNANWEGDDQKTNGDNGNEKGEGDNAQEAVSPEELESAEMSLCFSRNKEKVTKDDFELMTVIGKGSFGKVMQVKKKDTGKIYAMKVLRKKAIIDRKQVIHTRSEKSILQKIQHPFIVALNYAFQTEDKLYMVLDYINGGELFYHLKKAGKFPENRVMFYAAEISSALAHLHSFDIVYRDLKPENILLDSEGHICITDFGLSKEITPDGATHTFCGTPEYLAPEVLRGSGHSTPVDWWSLGTLIFEMLSGLPPFYSPNINLMYQKILHGELRFPQFFSPQAVSLLEGLLTRDVAKRLGDANIKAHPFFASIDWTKLDNKELEPPFKPSVTSDEDISQIDTQFTQEIAADSLVVPSEIAADSEGFFDGFTYIKNSDIMDAN
jgi:serine/threonine protein kinase